MGETKNEYVWKRKRLETARTETSREKRLHGKFRMGVTEVAGERSWQSLKTGYLGRACTRGAFLLLRSRLCKRGLFRR